MESGRVIDLSRLGQVGGFVVIARSEYLVELR